MTRFEGYLITNNILKVQAVPNENFHNAIRFRDIIDLYHIILNKFVLWFVHNLIAFNILTSSLFNKLCYSGVADCDTGASIICRSLLKDDRMSR